MYTQYDRTEFAKQAERGTDENKQVRDKEVTKPERIVSRTSSSIRPGYR